MKIFLKKIIASLCIASIIFITTFIFYKTQSFYMLFAKGSRLIRQERYMEARDVLLDALSINPSDIRTIQYIFLADEKLNSQAGTARVYEMIQQGSVKEEKLSLYIADYFYSQAYYEQAERIYKRFTSDEQRFGIKKKLAEVLVWQGKHEEALVLLEDLARTKGDDTDTKLLLADTSFWARHYEEAVRLYQELLASGVSDDDIMLNLAEALRFLGRHEEAVTIYDRYLEKEH